MDNQKIGIFIQQLRKEKGLTQVQLADKIGVSDKAVSKWERGLSFPDITLLPDLTALLGISLAEFFVGEKSRKNVIDQKEMDTLLNNTITYSSKQNREKLIKIISIGLAFATLTAIAVCMIVDVAITKSFTWSIIATAAMLLPWVTIITWYCMPKYKILTSIWATGIATVGFLMLIQYLIVFKVGSQGSLWVVNIALPITILGCLMLSIFYLCVKYLKHNIFYQLAIDVLVTALLGQFSINAIIAKVNHTDLFDLFNMVVVAIMLVISAGFAILGKVYSERSN